MNVMVLRTCVYLLQIMYTEDDIFAVNGVVNIVDMKGATISHFTQMTPLMMKKMVLASQVNEFSTVLSNLLI